MRHPSRRLALAGAVLGALLAAAPALAAYWRTPVLLATTASLVDLQSLGADGGIVAAGWRRPGSPSRLYVRVGTSAGDFFQAAQTLADDPTRSARELDLDADDGTVWAAWGEHRPTTGDIGRWQVFIGQRPAAGGAWSTGPVSTNTGSVRNPQLAVAGPRIWVAYQHPVGDGHRLRIQSAFTEFAAFDGGRDLGPAPVARGAAAVGAEDDSVAVAWADATGIRFRRADVATASPYLATWQPITTVSATGERPFLAVVGDRVIVAWENQSSIYARVSTDEGASFGALKLIGPAPANSAYAIDDLAAAGSRVMLQARLCTDAGCVNRRTRSSDGGGSWAPFVTVGESELPHLAAIVSKSAVLKEAELFQPDSDPLDVLYRRQE